MVQAAELRLDASWKALPQDRKRALDAAWLECAETILLATSAAQSGHPGGSLSLLHALLVTYGLANVTPRNVHAPDRDVVVISNGHVSPGVYATLAAFGFVTHDQVRVGFRRVGSAFAGHVEARVPGVEWNTGNLGQGFSAAVGAALARKLRGHDAAWAWAIMGDGEQQKGQIAEARRFAVKFGLNRIIGIIDRNHLQIGGATEDVMPQPIDAEWAAAGWNVVSVDGHDFDALFATLSGILRGVVERPDRPTVVVARTVMGKGVPFMENKAHFHGSAASPTQFADAMKHLGLADGLAALQARRAAKPAWTGVAEDFPPAPAVEVGPPLVRTAPADCRSAYGDVLDDLAKRNNQGPHPKVVGVSSDLEGSVKMSGFRKLSPAAFIEGGIQEHHNAVVAGRLAKEGFLTFFSTFGVFGVCETYNQQRLSDINKAGVKIVCTHLGLDVGEDGPTHQNIDAIGLLRGIFGFQIFLPVDANQTDHVVRHVAQARGNHFVGMGRSKLPIVTKADGTPFYDAAYRFEPGRMDTLLEGDRVAVISTGTAMQYALAGARIAAERGLSVLVLAAASIRPFDAAAVARAARTGAVLTVEDHGVHTGLGALVAETVADAGLRCRLQRMGVSRYGTSGPSPDVFAEAGITAESVARALEVLAG